MSDSVRPHRRQPTRLPRPWDSPGKNTGVGCHFLLQCMKVKSESEVAHSCPTLSNLVDCSLPGSSAHGIFQARVLEWGAIAFSKDPSENHQFSSSPQKGNGGKSSKTGSSLNGNQIRGHTLIFLLQFHDSSPRTSLVAQTVKRLPTMRETQVQSLGQEDPLQKGMATHSSTLAWKIPWVEEPGRLQSMGLQTVGYD